MKSTFLEYLQAIDVLDPIIERVADLLPLFEFLCPEPIERLFITTTIEPVGGAMALQSLFAFSATYWLECKDFLRSDNADLTPYANSVTYVGLEYENMSFGGRVQTSSRVVVEVQTGSNLTTTLTAVGKNCEYLQSIVKEVFVCQMRKEIPGGA
jgi:hypothetical protein